MNKVIEEIKSGSFGKFIENASLKKFTTYKVGGIAKVIVYPKDTNQLINLLKLIKQKNINYKILGNGSNLLFSDKEYNGVLIKLDEFNKIEIQKNYITVGAGYSLMKLAALATRKSLAGLEFAAGIPGTVGGAIFMNAGAYKSDMGYIVKKIKVLTPDFRIISMTNSELDFHYRTSFLQKNPEFICLEATLTLRFGKKDKLLEVNRDRKQRRLNEQPLEFPSAGSVFRNPEGLSSGKLIDDLGLKGLSKGDAQISEKHANFIINKGNAKAKDIKELMEFTKNLVKEKYNIDLKIEQEFVNWE